jgi:hypothetical protein
MTKYEVEVDYTYNRERQDRKVYDLPIIVRYFEDGQLLAEIRSKREVRQ